MAAIAPKALLRFSAGLLLSCKICLWADQPDGLRTQLNTIATALSAGDPSAAMGPFSKSYGSYDKLRNYFSGLTNAFSIANEVDVTDEQEARTEIRATVHWAITLSTLGSDNNNQRSADIQVRCVREKEKWKIADFAPIDLFDPSLSQTPTPPPQSSSRSLSYVLFVTR